MLVVMHGVLVQDRVQVPSPGDEHPGVDLAVGALMAVDADHYVVDQLVGVTTEGLRNLRVGVGAGLGAKATLHD